MDNSAHNLTADNNEIIQERKKRIFSKRSVILFFFSLCLLLLLISRLEIQKTLSAFKNADLKLVLLGTIIYSFSNFFKTLRFKVLLKNFNIKTRHLFTIVSYHNFFNQILPARTGELTLVYYLKKTGGIDVAKGLHSLLIARMFDLITVSFFFVTSIIAYYGSESSKSLVILGLASGIISILIMFNLGLFIHIVYTIIDRASIIMKIRNKSIIAVLMKKLSEIINEFKSFDTRRSIPLLIVTSILVWTALYVLSYISILVFAVDIEILRSIIGSTGAVLTNVLPINSFGSFGTLEAGWTGGFVLVGMSETEAITTGFGYHIITFFSSAVLALCCSLIYNLFRIKKNNRAKPEGKYQ